MSPSPVLPKLDYFVYSTAEQKARILSNLDIDEKCLERDALTLLEWVNKQPHLPNLDESDLQFLQFYLVASKNSMEKTKKGLDTYYTARTVFQNLFRPSPFIESQLTDLSKYASVIAAPKMTKSLSRVIVIRYHNHNPVDGDLELLMRTMLLKADILFRSDWSGGVEAVFDLSSYMYAHSMRFLRSVSDVKNCLTIVMNAYPSRVRAIHLFKPPPVFNTAFSIVQPFLKEKIRQRVIMHPDVKSLHKSIDPSLLTSELGGELPPAAELEAQLTKFMVGCSDFLAYQNALIVDESKRTGGSSPVFQTESYGMEGSFRKLELD